MLRPLIRHVLVLGPCLVFLVLVYVLLRPGGDEAANLWSPLGAEQRPYPPPPRKDNATLTASAGPKARTQLRVTDPRFDQYVLGLKSGAEVAVDHIPMQLLTFARGVKNVYLFGDATMHFGEFEMANVIDHLYENTDAELNRTNSWERANKPIVNRPPNHEKRDLSAALANDPDAASPKLFKRENADHEVQTDNSRQGWKMDAHKFIPAAREMYMRWPNASWFIMLDDDTYLFMDNMHRELQKYDPNKPWYIGSGTLFVGCDGVQHFGEGPLFAHGGSGIIMSREALKRMLGVSSQIPHKPAAAAECIHRYKDCWAGDIRLALCLRDAGVLIKSQLFGPASFNIAPPHWTKHPYDDAPCRRNVITFHHLTSQAMHKIYLAEKLAFNKSLHMTPKTPVTKDSHPHLFTNLSPELKAQLWPDLPAHIPSPFYAPVHQDDLWQFFVDQDPELREVESDHARGGTNYHTVHEVRTADACRQECLKDKECRAWEFQDTGACHFKKAVVPPGDHKGWYSGIIKGRYVCENRGL